MWRLDVVTKKLKVFVSERDVQYAAFSHAWGDEEVTFPDIQHLKVDGMERLRSWQETIRPCGVAMEQKLDFGWTNTW